MRQSSTQVRRVEGSRCIAVETQESIVQAGRREGGGVGSSVSLSVTLYEKQLLSFERSRKNDKRKNAGP